MFRQKLYYIKNNINSMVTREEAFERCVAKKLECSLDNYGKSLKRTCDYLMTRPNQKVIRTLAKKEKKKSE